MSKYKCPYCNVELEKFPLRKTKCKACGKFYYSKRLPSETKKRIVTEKEKKQIDKQWDEKFFLDEWCAFFSTFDFTKGYIKRHIGSFKIKRDGAWSLFQKALAVALKRNKFHEASMLYYKMAIFVAEENKDPFEYLKLSSKMSLLNYKNQGTKKVRILSAGSLSCSECNEQNGEVYSIDEALNKMPLPNKNCSYHFYPENKRYSFCRCVFIPKVEIGTDRIRNYP